MIFQAEEWLVYKLRAGDQRDLSERREKLWRRKDPRRILEEDLCGSEKRDHLSDFKK